MLELSSFDFKGTYDVFVIKPGRNVCLQPDCVHILNVRLHPELLDGDGPPVPAAEEDVGVEAKSHGVLPRDVDLSPRYLGYLKQPPIRTLRTKLEA